MVASASPSPPQQQPQWSHRLRPPSARLAGINTITITWSPGGQLPATSRLLLAACQGCWRWRRAGRCAETRGAGAAVLRLRGGRSHTPLLTCGPQAELHAAPLEFTAALGFGHNEVAAMQTGYEGGEATVLAAATQARRDPERPRASPATRARRGQDTAGGVRDASCTPLGAAWGAG